MNSRNNGRIDWLALDGEAVAVTVEEIGPPKDYGYGPIPEVVCRVIVLTGPTAGAVYPAQRVTAAGIRTKLEEHRRAPSWSAEWTRTPTPGSDSHPSAASGPAT